MNTLQHKGYYGSVEYDTDNQCFSGKVLGMTHDSITYEGQTETELEQDFIAGIESYLESCKELGIKPRKGFTGTLNIRLSPEIYSKLTSYVETHNTNVNTFVRNSLKRQLQVAV